MSPKQNKFYSKHSLEQQIIQDIIVCKIQMGHSVYMYVCMYIIKSLVTL